MSYTKLQWRWVALLVATILAIFLIVTVTDATGFSNGRAGSGDTSSVFLPQSGNHATLSKSGAAASFNTMRQCAIRAGVDLSPQLSTYHPAATAYRSIAQQVSLWQAYKSGRGALAAYPGTSNHGWGNAVDLRLPAMRAWIDSHGREFGWAKVEAFSEWWHVNYIAGRFSRPDPGTSLLSPYLATGSGGKCLGPAVKELQRLLGVNQSGNFGNGTRQHLKERQRDLICKKCGSGVVGPTTWRVLRANKPSHKATPPKYVQLTPKRMRGQNVIAVEGLLNARRKEVKKAPIKIGPFNHEWSLALKNFQRSRHLEPSGKAGPKTLASLRIPAKSARTKPVTPSSAKSDKTLKKLGAKVGYTSSVKKAAKDYGCAKVHTNIKRQTCKVRFLRAKLARRSAYAKTQHGAQRAKWLKLRKHTREQYNAAKATLRKLTAKIATMDEEGVRFVAGFEGLFHRCYNDPVGFATIGYGHLIRYARCTASDMARYLTTKQALALLHVDLRASEAVVRAAVKVPLTQLRFNRLGSFVFNVGAGGFRSSTLLAKLNSGCYACVRSELLRWVRGGGQVLPGLVRRRVAEGRPF